MPEQFDDLARNESILNIGNEVGDLAMGYFGEYVEVPFSRDDFQSMITKTQQLLATNTPIICEATFAHGGNLCMVDILRVENDGVHIVEVKATTSLKKYHVEDASYQFWLLKQCGLNVKSAGIMHLNPDYSRQGELVLQDLFVIEDVTDEASLLLPLVPSRIQHILDVVGQDEEPSHKMGQWCNSPHECGYKAWCERVYPKPNVFDLNNMRITKAVGLVDEGIVTFEDVYNAGLELSVRQMQQVLCEVNNAESFIDKHAIQEFLDRLSLPIYFLDFETIQPAVPLFDGTKPWQQIPTQYSLHIMDADASLEHKEFLAEEGKDSRRALAEHLCEDIPMGACTVAYNISFEKGRILELGEAFPDLAIHLKSIAGGMVDLIEPFRQGAYYHRNMGGSNSIKAVLPALFPDDSELDYHALEGVQNGADAMKAYADLVNRTPEERFKIREQLLRYCELDTLAMVKIYEKLIEAVG